MDCQALVMPDHWIAMWASPVAHCRAQTILGEVLLRSLVTTSWPVNVQQRQEAIGQMNVRPPEYEVLRAGRCAYKLRIWA